MAGTATVRDPGAEVARPGSPRGGAQSSASFDLSPRPLDHRSQVVPRLPPRGAAALVTTSTQMRDDHGNAVRTARETQLSLINEAQAADLETIDRLLNSPAGITALPSLFQVAPREAIAKRLPQLARQLENLPEQDRPARFSALLNRAQALGAEGDIALMYITPHMADLPEEARHGAFRDVANRLKLLPVDNVRTIASVMLSVCIQALPKASRDEAIRQIVEVRRPLSGHQSEELLATGDDQLPPAIKDALRQAIAEDEATSPSRAGTSARA